MAENNGKAKLTEISASKILDEIKNGGLIEHDHVRIVGKLDLSERSFLTEPVDRTGYQLTIPKLLTESKKISSSIKITNSEFMGIVDFSNCSLKGDASFNGTTFSVEASFLGTTFGKGNANFDGATFCGIAIFSGATFGGDTNFNGTKFSNGDVYFDGTTFSSDAGFIGTVFGKGKANFGGATFSKIAMLSGATFGGNVDFGGATFDGKAWFIEDKISGNAVFTGAKFSTDAYFDGTIFSGNASFNEITFQEDTLFEGVNFNGKLDLTKTKYKRLFIRWEQIKKAICYETKDLDGETKDSDHEYVYLSLVENFKNLGFFEDADDCYYTYRMARNSHLLNKIYRVFDSILWLFYGYGVKPLRPLGGLVVLLVAFGLLYSYTGVAGNSTWNAFNTSITLSLAGTKLIDDPNHPTTWMLYWIFTVEKLAASLFFAMFLVSIGRTIIR